MRIIFIIFLSFVFSFLHATDTEIQDSILESKKESPYKALNFIFPDSYVRDVLTGIISTIEDTFFKINIRRISVDFSSTNINVSDKYEELKVNQFNGDNSTVAMFKSELALEYNFDKSRLSNELNANYGFIILSPKNKPSTRTKTADEILLSVSYTRKSLLLENGFIGPFINGEYQTEFEQSHGDDGKLLPRNQILRYKAGIRMLDGKYINELYLSGVGEIDFTTSLYNVKGAIETGIRAETPITDYIRLVYQGFYRQYIGFTRFREDDLLFNINLNMRLDVSVYNGFALSPFISARFAQIRSTNTIGSNITAGVALLYSNTINAISSIKNTQNTRLKQYYKAIND